MEKPLLHENHPRPVTRRDFLAQGFIGFSATVMGPTALSLLLDAQARADGTCPPVGATAGRIPFLVFDMAGGGALAANFLVGGAGGPMDLLPNYDVLGWDPRAATPNAVDARFGLPMAGGGVSKIMQGMLDSMSAGAQAGLRFGSFCHFGRDDTRANQVSALSMVSKAGLRGSLITTGVGTVATFSGGNSDGLVDELALKPLQVKSVSDIVDSLSYGPALSQLRPSVLAASAQALLKLSLGQAAKYSQLSLGDQLGQLDGCGLQRNLAFTGTITGTDPRLEPNFQALYNLNAATPATSADAVSATVVMNVLKGQTGPGCITIGGCDYHDGTQATGDGKDLQTGHEIGRAVEAAYRMGKPLAFQLVTDGAVYPRKGTRIWQGDSGDKSLTLFGLFQPAGMNRRAQQRRLQVGCFTAGQGADRSTLVGSDPIRAGYASFANYLALCGSVGDFNSYFPNVFTAAELDSVLLFG